MNDFKIKYPIRESKVESWEHFRRIRDLTSKVYGHSINQAFPFKNIRFSWWRICLIWRKEHLRNGYPNFFYEALYHLCFKKFTTNVNSNEELLLVLLVEDELISCSISFDVWRKSKFLRDSHDKVCSLVENCQTFNGRSFQSGIRYIKENLRARMFLKNVIPKSMAMLPRTGSKVSNEYARMALRYVEGYETVICFLVPEAVSWQEEWADLDYLLTRMDEIYGINFMIDTSGLDALIDAVKHRKQIDSCACRLFNMQDATAALLKRLWGDQYMERFQDCFMCIYRRYRKSSMSARGRYTYDVVTQNWIYTMMLKWNMNKSINLRKDVRRALFDMSLQV